MFFYFLTSLHCIIFFFFFFNDTATTEIYTLSLHDALPISTVGCRHLPDVPHVPRALPGRRRLPGDRHRGDSALSGQSMGFGTRGRGTDPGHKPGVALGGRPQAAPDDPESHR